MKSIVVIPGLSPTWVDQHARHLAQRLTQYGRVMVVSSRGRARARIMPGEMGRESVLGAGGGPVADVGCGPGYVTHHLHDAGVDAFGIDLSPEMVALARRHAGIGAEGADC